MARRSALREEFGAAPLIDIQRCERSNRELSGEAVFLILVFTPGKVLCMKSQNPLIKRPFQNLEAAA
jgi:hypothetical protein